MANKKFSQFELKTDQSDVDFLVGYTGTENVQIASEKVGLRYDLLSGQSAANPLNYEFRLEDNAGGGVDKVTLVAGDNIVLTSLSPIPNVGAVKIDVKRGALISVVGIWKNLFGGSPGIFGDTLEFAASATPAASNSSVFQVPFDCKLIKAQMKWIHATPVNIPLANSTWDVNIYSMTNPALSTTQTSSYSLLANLPTLSLTTTDTGTFPSKTWDGIVNLQAGQIINISGVENGGIGTDDAEMELCLIFEQLF